MLLSSCPLPQIHTNCPLSIMDIYFVHTEIKKVMPKVAMRVSTQNQGTTGLLLVGFFPHSFLLAWPGIQETCNTLVYPPVIPAVTGLEPISVILIH